MIVIFFQHLQYFFKGFYTMNNEGFTGCVGKADVLCKYFLLKGKICFT
jgi:hypothetical protein